MEKEKLFQKIVRQEGLQIVDLLHHWEEPRFIVAEVTNKTERRMVLKVLVSENWWDEESFEREVVLLRLAQKAGLGNFVPALIRSNLEEESRWYLREFVDGSIAGDIVTDFGFREKFNEIISPTKATEGLKEIWYLPTVVKASLVERRAKERGHLEESIVLVEAIDHPNRVQWEKYLQKFMLENEKFLEAAPLVFGHIDLYPKNILFSRGSGELKIIDWEHYGRWYVFCDAVFIYLLAWRDWSWQEKFKDNVRKEFFDWAKSMKLNFSLETLDKSWQTMLYYWGVRLLNHAVLMKNRYQAEDRDALRERASASEGYLIETVFDKIKEI